MEVTPWKALAIGAGLYAGWVVAVAAAPIGVAWKAGAILYPIVSPFVAASFMDVKPMADETIELEDADEDDED